MKKVYLLASALVCSSALMAQWAVPKGGLTPFSKPAPAERTVKHSPEHNSNADRGAAFFTETFSNGFSGDGTNGTWTADGTLANSDIWKHDFFGTSGCWSGNTPTPGFSTAGNGFMLFDCDSANCTDPNPNPPIFTQDVKEGALISPVIDLSLQSTVNIIFEQYLRYCCGGAQELYLGVSTDGTNWTEYDVLGGLATNDASGNPDVVNINVTADIAGSSTAQIRFRWGANSHYYWAIDDINLVPSPDWEVALIGGGYESTSLAGADFVPYTMVPDEQAQDFRFFGTLSNQGANTVDVSLEAEVFDGGSVFTYSGTPVTLTAGQSAYDSSGTFWNSGTTQTLYDIVVDFDYDSIVFDNDNTNNVDSHWVQVTDEVYGRDLDTYSGAGLWNGAGDPYVMGPVYHMETTQTLNVIECALTGSTMAGAFIYGQVYWIDPNTGDFVLVFDGGGTSGEFEVKNYHISNSAPHIIVNIPVPGGLQMDAGEEYIVCVGHYGGAQDIVIMNGGITAPDQTVFLLDGTDNTWYFTTSTPLIRANFGADDGVGVVEVEGGLSLGQNMPNPFNGTTQIKYTIEQSADVVFEITDVTGKVVRRIAEGTQMAGEHIVTLNADELAEGIYNYTVTAGELRATKRMVVTK